MIILVLLVLFLGVMKEKICRNLSYLPNVPERVIYNVTLYKSEKQRLGLTIVGGKERLLDGIFIKKIQQGGLAQASGQLQAG